MAFLRSYEGPDPDELDDYAQPVYSISWPLSVPSSGPSEAEVPMPDLCTLVPAEVPAEPRNTGVPSAQQPRQKNPVPSTGSRRDQCGKWSIGSEGHDEGLCQGPCRDLRSGRGCTYGRKCKKCHLPHPEVSSTSIRGRRPKAKKALEPLIAAQRSGIEDNGAASSQSDIRTDAMSEDGPLGHTSFSL